MNKKLNRLLAGVLSVMFVGQIMIYGDGSSQGIAHAETIAGIKESLQLSENAAELQQEYENAVDGLGKVDYFDYSESGANAFYKAQRNAVAANSASGLTISGNVVTEGNLNTPVYVRIFNGDWAEIASKKVADFGGGSFSINASGSDVYHVKFECDGYLPFYLKDFGTGSYTVGSGDSWDTVTLVPGDTTYNADNDNQWSDDVIDENDAAYVSQFIGKRKAIGNYEADFDMNGDGSIDAEDLKIIDRDHYEKKEGEAGYIAELDINGNGEIDADDYNYILENHSGSYVGDPEYKEYMDRDNDGEIGNDDAAWFANASYQGDWDHAFKRNMKVLAGGAFPYSFNLHDTNLDLNGQTISVADCMSFTTDMPQFWAGNGATLDINGGQLLIQNNMVFRTASPDGWGGSTGQLMNINGGQVVIGQHFDFGQANCYDTILMTNDADRLYVGGNWTYITLQDMEGKWTAGQIRFAGPTWEVNEHSGDKSIYSSGTQSIIFGYDGGKQTILWDNPETYIDNEDGSYNTERRFNFDYKYGILVTKEFTEENFWFRPWWRPYDEPDYTLYRKGWEIGDGVHIATGNFTKSFTDLSIASPGVKSDFVRTYNSMNKEEGSFGIGWDFNIDVSKIVIPAQGYYQVVLPDGSNTTFKDNGNGGFECLNAHSKMTKSGGEYTVTNAAQSQYHFNDKGELDWVKDANGNKLTISSKSNNQRIVTDSTGRTYTIKYRDVSGHNRIESISDDNSESNRIVTYEYNGNAQLVSATSVSGGTEKYEYDENGRLCKITNCCYNYRI